MSLPKHTKVLWQLGVGHYNTYYNISSSKRYRYIYRRQVYHCPFKWTFQIEKDMITACFHHSTNSSSTPFNMVRIQHSAPAPLLNLWHQKEVFASLVPIGMPCLVLEPRTLAVCQWHSQCVWWNATLAALHCMSQFDLLITLQRSKNNICSCTINFSSNLFISVHASLQFRKDMRAS
jgi:hypothetical protein